MLALADDAVARIKAAAEAVGKRFEGYSLKAYPDSGGIWTIGRGHTGAYPHKGQVQQGDVITPDQVEMIWQWDWDRSWRTVARVVNNVGLTENELAVLLDLEFNTGALPNSHLLQAVNSGQLNSIPARLASWDHGEVDGREVEIEGLKNRRAAEIVLWNTAPGDVAMPAPATT